MAAVAAAGLVAAACGGEPDDPPDVDPATDAAPQEPATDDDPIDDPADDDPDGTSPPDVDTSDEPDVDGPVTDDEPADGTGDDTGDDAEDDEVEGDAVQPLSGDPSTDRTEDEGDGFGGALTDVRVATHDGFDRVVAEVEGEAEPGWFAGYEDEAVSDPSGEPLEIEGDAFLAVAVRNLTLPPELPDDLEHWQEDAVDGPEGGVVQQVVNDSVFEGQHRLVIGLDEERPYLVARYEDPSRVVIDVFHD